MHSMHLDVLFAALITRTCPLCRWLCCLLAISSQLSRSDAAGRWGAEQKLPPGRSLEDAKKLMRLVLNALLEGRVLERFGKAWCVPLKKALGLKLVGPLPDSLSGALAQKILLTHQTHPEEVLKDGCLLVCTLVLSLGCAVLEKSEAFGRETTILVDQAVSLLVVNGMAKMLHFLGTKSTVIASCWLLAAKVPGWIRWVFCIERQCFAGEFCSGTSKGTSMHSTCSWHPYISAYSKQLYSQ